MPNYTQSFEDLQSFGAKLLVLLENLQEQVRQLEKEQREKLELAEEANKSAVQYTENLYLLDGIHTKITELIEQDAKSALADIAIELATADPKADIDANDLEEQLREIEVCYKKILGVLEENGVEVDA